MTKKTITSMSLDPKIFKKFKKESVDRRKTVSRRVEQLMDYSNQKRIKIIPKVSDDEY